MSTCQTYPNPPRLWSRFSYNCPNYNNYNKLNERRKAEIFKYKNNSANLSKKQQFSRVNRGYTEKKNTFATQNSSSTNPNLLNLPLNNTVLQCKQSKNYCGLTSQNDVPGKVRTLCLDPKVPLYNYKVRRTYKAGNNKWPYYFNKDPPYNQVYG
jgi:hypothetical protein